MTPSRPKRPALAARIPGKCRGHGRRPGRLPHGRPDAGRHSGEPAAARTPSTSPSSAPAAGEADNLEAIAATGAVNIVAICDCDERQAGDAFKRYPNAARFADWRRLLDSDTAFDARRRLDARSQPRHHCDLRHAARQACLLREAAGAQHLRGARDGAGGGRAARGDADGDTGPRLRRHAPRRGGAARRRHRRGHRAARVDRPAGGVVAPGNRCGQPRRRRCPRGSTGTCGWVRRHSVRTTPPTCHSNGAASGTSAQAPSATWASTTSIRRTGASNSARRLRWSVKDCSPGLDRRGDQGDGAALEHHRAAICRTRRQASR